MITLKELINALTEIANLDPENLTAQVKIYDKYIFITRSDQEDGYYIKIK